MPRPPFQFKNFVGQKKNVAKLLQQAEGAKFHGEPFPDFLVLGPSGVGKTLLTRTLASAFGSDLIIANGLSQVRDIAAKLKRLKTFDFLFVDEAHRLKGDAQELLYDVIDYGKLPNWFQETKQLASDSQESVEVAICPCTIVLATNRPGGLLEAMIKRVKFTIDIEYYSDQELKLIVELVATKLGLLLTPQAANLVARISLGLPRRAKHHLENLRRQLPGTNSVDIKHVREFMDAFDLDECGFGILERKYLACLAEVQIASLNTLAGQLGTDPEHLAQQIEPLLLRAKLISIGRQGRQLTSGGKGWIQGMLAQNANKRQMGETWKI